MDSNVEEDLEGTGLCIKEFNLISEYKKDKKEKLLCSDRFIRNCFIDKEVYMQLFYLQTTVVEVEKKSEKKKLKEKEFEENGISDEVEVKKKKKNKKLKEK